MRTLARQVIEQYSLRRFCAVVRLLNEHAALHDGLFESNVQGRPYVGFNGLVLTASERNELVYLTETFSAIMTKAMAAIVEASPAALRALGWPEHLEYALRHEPPNRSLTPI